MSGHEGQRHFSREFKLAALARMASGENVSALSRELGVARKCLYQWRERFRLGGALGLRGRGRMTKAERAEMEAEKRGGLAVREELSALPPGRAPPVDPPAELARARARIAELESKVAQQSLDLDFFKGALQKIEARRQSNKQAGETASTTKSGS